MEQVTNQIRLRGSLCELPEFSHDSHGKRFYRFQVEVPRLSGTVDILPVITGESVLNRTDLSGGDMLMITGQIRSHNYRSEGSRHLLIFVYAESIEAQHGEPMNCVTLDGNLCREPVFRKTPLGREICDCMLAVPRSFHRADYLPCILWGRTAQEAAALNIRDRIVIQGRLQSRQYTKLTESGAARRTAYEISALTAEFPPMPLRDTESD